MHPNDIIRKIVNQPNGARCKLPDCEKVEYVRAGLLLIKVSLN